MEIEVELEEGEEVKVKCPRCKGKGMVHITKSNGVFEGTQCSECGGTGEKRLELAEGNVVYTEIDEGEIMEDVEPMRHPRSI